MTTVTLAAEAPRAASIMSSSSTRCSCTGATSGWIRKTSRSRQFAFSCTSRQSFANRVRVEGCSGMPSSAQISAASSRWALPENTAMSRMGRTLAHRRSAIVGRPVRVRRRTGREYLPNRLASTELLFAFLFVAGRTRSPAIEAVPKEHHDVSERRVTADPTIGDRVYRKVTRRLLPVMGLCYFLSYLDRTNVAIAKIGEGFRRRSPTQSSVWGPDCSSSAIWCSRCRPTWRCTASVRVSG